MGKSTFDASRLNAFSFEPEKLVLVSDSTHPLYDPRMELPLDEGLVKNIMCYGVIEPIVIAKISEKPVVIDGRQRVRAAVEANKRLKKSGSEIMRVPCVVYRGTEADLYGVSVSANEARQDDLPLAKAKKAAKLMNMGKSEEEVAIAFGVTPQAVTQWLKLLECSGPVQKAVERGQLSASAASKLSRLDGQEQTKALDELLTEAKATGKRPTAQKVAKAAGQKAARMRSRKEILQRLEEKRLPEMYRKALLWVLGEDA